jgi:hypothetical protein
MRPLVHVGGCVAPAGSCGGAVAPPWASSQHGFGLPLSRCGLSSLLGRLCTVLPEGSCVKVRLSRPRCWRTAVAGPGRPRGQAAHARAGRGVGGGRWTVWWQRAPTPLVRRCAPKVGRAVFYCRAVCRGSGRCGRRPMAGEASGAGRARRPLPWPASGRCCSSALKGYAI